MRDAIFPIASRFNHACSPNNNVKYVVDNDSSILVLTVVKDTPAGDELFVSYGTNAYDLSAKYGFDCQCPSCVTRPVVNTASLWD